MNISVTDSKKYYDAVLEIYQQVIENNVNKVSLTIKIQKENVNISLLQDFLDLLMILQKEFEFILNTEIQTDIPELQHIHAPKGG
ncbi:hypothetical protein HF872_09390 [Megasphaera hexanoica]|uniref:Uncharacterized protein n=1 Tax=Megasphaera hexanoica TaxID=1675036 RepID=A0A848C0J2_9FIRM|nr:hypothetical protein [Megasphaera hexanoica]